jgi:hypothetical protein
MGPGKCRNKDNVEGPIRSIGNFVAAIRGMKGLLTRRGFLTPIINALGSKKSFCDRAWFALARYAVQSAT